MFYFYTRRKKNEWGELLDRLAHKSGYELALSLKSDRRHAGYLKELYPTPDDWQVITDIGVVEALRREGDMEGVRRRIDHWAHFPTAKSAAKFVTLGADRPAQARRQAIGRGRGRRSTACASTTWAPPGRKS